MILDKYFTKEEIEKLRNEPDLYVKCYILVSRLFDGVMDRGGYPYLGHLERVSSRLESIEEKCAGLLHDTLEDIEGATVEDLRYLNIPESVITIVELVTNSMHDEVEYSKKIDKIIASGNYGAIRLKYSDMTDNYNEERLYYLPIETQERLRNKYKPNYEKLKKVLGIA